MSRTASCRRNNSPKIFRRIAAGSRPVLPPAAKAALDALMQQTRSAAAAISMINLMA
jgi:hypothetical protein